MTLKEWMRRRKIVRTLKSAMHGLTLNSIGPLYGCKRKSGEDNRSFEKRILKTAMTSDKTWIFAGGTAKASIDNREVGGRENANRGC